MLVFLFAVVCLFIQPYGWIITLSLLVITIVYYATGADLAAQQRKVNLRIRIEPDQASDEGN